MRALIFLLMMVPAFAQQPAAPPKPAEPKPEAAAPAKPEEAAPAKQEEAASPVPAPAGDGWLTGSIDAGYRWVTDVQGNFQQYRSVVNQPEGPRLFGFDLTFQDPKKRLFDRANVRAYGWGGDPYSTANVMARKAGWYDFRFDYRDLNFYNNIRSFANPVSPLGISQQSFDLQRKNTSASLDLFTGYWISPYLAFDHNAGDGTGVDTWMQGVNEYPVPLYLRDSTNNYRGGLRFELPRFRATLEQGSTTFKDDTRTNWTGTNLGNRTTPILGQTLQLNSLNQAYGIRGDSKYSKLLLAANPFSWFSIHGEFLYSQPQTKVSYSDVASGNFFALSQLLSYGGQLGLAGGSAIQPHVTGDAGFELRPFRRLRILESWTTDRFHDAAFGIATTGLFTSLTQPIAAGSDVTALDTRQVVNYNRQQVDVIFDLTKHLSLRAGHRYIFGDTTVRAGSLSQTGNFASGQLERHVALVGGSYRPNQKIWFNADYETSDSDQIYYRTSLNDYHKTRLRAKYQPLTSLGFQASYNTLHNENPSPQIAFEYENRDASLAAFFTPNDGKHISVTAEYERTSLHSDIRYLDLPFLNSAESSYRERAHTATMLVDLALPFVPKAKLSAGGSLYILTGTRPTRYYQPLGRLSIPVCKNVYWNTEWQYYGFGEEFFQFESFRTHVVSTGIRITR